MNKKIKQFFDFLKPYKGILLFLFLLFFFHFLWKIAIDGDMGDDFVYFFGKDITPEWFHTACQWLVSASAWFIRLFPNTQDLIVNGQRLSFPGNNWSTHVVWGCLGFKQMSIFAGVMLFYWGPFLKKLWYIPLGCIILTIYNIIRIGLLVVLTNGHHDRFDFFHDGIFRYIYYTIIFLLWVIWEEFIVNKNNHLWKTFVQIFKH